MEAQSHSKMGINVSEVTLALVKHDPFRLYRG